MKITIRQLLGHILYLKQKRKMRKKQKRKMRKERQDIELIRESGLFDAVFYQKKYKEYLDDGEDPVYHYLCQGWQIGLDPSPKFSTWQYLDLYQDIKAAKINPLVHFLRYGRKEGRNPKPLKYVLPFPRITPPEAGKPDLILFFNKTCQTTLDLSRERICVHLHLYHEDMLDMLCRYLAHIKHDFTLLVSVKEQARTEEIKTVLGENLPCAKRIIVRQVANRGRDTAPWLVSFREEIQKHTLFCHIHTKRSIHSTTGGDWYRYLCHATLGSAPVVEQILSAFADSSVGIVAPCYHWTIGEQPIYGNNREICESLHSRICARALPDICPDYPAGSFFWARTSVLKPLFDLDFHEEDFDKEPIALDATLVHGIERIIGCLPELAGMKYLKATVDVAHDMVETNATPPVFDKKDSIFDIPACARFDDREPKTCSYLKALEQQTPFASWVRLNGDSRVRRSNLEHSSLADQSITFSIITPVYNIAAPILDACITSVLSQSYKNFELILVDDGSDAQETLDFLRQNQMRDKRLKIIFRQENGHISRATNDGIDAAVGDYMIFLDNDDLLADHALAIAANYIRDHHYPHLLYSDDARFQHDRRKLYSPQFKPGWSPELLFAFCYISHVKIVASSLVRQLGGFRVGFEGSQDHDFLLRAGEATDHIVHIPHILYHRRVLPDSTAASGHAKPYTFEAGRKASEEAFNRRGVACSVIHPDWAYQKGCGIYTPVMPDDGPCVTLLIPTRNNKPLLDRLLRSLQKTTYKNHQIVIIDNISDDPETLEFLDSLSDSTLVSAPLKIVKIANPDGQFNFSHINNQAAKHINSDFILFLNDDVEVISGNWLSQMVGWAQLSGIGVVGARLLFSDGRVQHGGVVPSLPGNVGRTAFRGLAGSEPGYLFAARVSRNCSAVTAACMITPTKLFKEIGGFDAQNFPVAYSDVDYCLRVRALGKRIVYCGEIELYHHEGASRGLNRDAIDGLIAYEEKYGSFEDPYYNSNLSFEDNRFSVKPTALPPQKTIQPIKLLALTHNLNPEGAPNSAFQLLSGLHKKGGFDITVLSMLGGVLREKYLREDIKLQISPVSFNRHMKAEEYDDFLKRFTEAVKLDQYDLVYANTVTLFWAIDAAARQNIPSIWNIRESETWKHFCQYYTPDTSIASRTLQCFALPYRTMFVANSTMKRWKPLDVMNNFTVVPNAPSAKSISELKKQYNREDARAQLGFSDDDIVLLNLGTICPRKGQHDMLLAFLKLPPEIQKKVKLLFVGGRPSAYMDYLHTTLEKLPAILRSSVKIIDETSDTAAYWRAADVFVCTSRLESYPRVILEAMEFCLPIITTVSYGIAEQIIDGYNAETYIAGDIDNLAHQITKLASDNKRRKEFAAASAKALKLCMQYDTMIERCHKIFTQAAFSSVPMTLGPIK